MISPWISVEPLPDGAFGRLRRRAIFECQKWDPQVGDVCTIARHPLVITKQAWNDVVTLAESLAVETRTAEAELLQRPALHAHLGLPRRVKHALKAASSLGAPREAARLMRFDFHFTTGGWRISEVNSDVPGGLNEASGFPLLMREHYPWTTSVGDPASAYARALTRQIGPGGTVALVHATAYTDDLQVMALVARKLTANGVRVHLASPAHLRWQDGLARLESAWWRGPLDLVVRFFPAEWLIGLPDATAWGHLFAASRTPLSNPATAILTQSKRFPLVWDDLRTPVANWRALLPETRDARYVPGRQSSDWIIKPALGRVGEGVWIPGVNNGDRRRIVWSARLRPAQWIAQRRFAVIPVRMGGKEMYPCLGVYTLDGQVIGAYGRLAPVPLVDSRAIDAAVLAA